MWLSKINSLLGLYDKPSPGVPTLSESTAVAPSFKIDVDQRREDAPEFTVEYKGQLNSNVRCEVLAYSRSWNTERSYIGTLRQGYKSVSFDPQNIADKILDRDILPLVKDFCKLVLKSDDEFISSSPNSFVDRKGTKWIKAPK